MIVGAGGIGAPASIYLAGAGVGVIGLVDADKVEISNLHRQIIHTTERVGVNKVYTFKNSSVVQLKNKSDNSTLWLRLFAMSTL